MVNPLFGVNAGRKLRSVSAPESAAAQEEEDGDDEDGDDLSASQEFKRKKVKDGDDRKKGKGGTIFTAAEYGDFIARVEIKLPKGGNNGLAIRYPGKGDTAYVGMCELQVLDNTAKKFGRLRPQQYHGSVYGQVAARRGFLRAPGTWNFQEVTVKGSRIRVELNGYVIVDADILKDAKYMTKKDKFRGRGRKKGHFGFAGHGDPVEFRNVRIKTL